MITRAKNPRGHVDRLATALLAGALLFGGIDDAYADSGAGSVTASAVGSVMVLHGSGQVLTGGARFVVESVHTAADGSILILNGVSEAVQVSLRIVGDSVISATTLAGKVLTVSVTAAGHILHAGGEVVAFVPNAASQTLMHSSVHRGPSPASNGYDHTEPWLPADDRQTSYGRDN